MVQLDCGDCHRPAAADGVWPYADANYLSKSVTYKDDAVLLPVMAALTPRGARDGREYMATPKYATACAGCHLLTFDKRFDVGAPHDKPEVVHAFVMKKFGEYIAAHPGELREMQEPDRALTGNPPLPSAQSLRPERRASGQRLNFLYLIRVGMVESTPRRRFLSSS